MEEKNTTSKKAFSPEQEDAINTRDRTLLVSAAAGSGKTTTLTERIIRSLLDEKNPESLTNMLIVTFTNASVYDLKEKISEALTNAALENPENKRLEDELRSLDYARIMTIDSFCAQLVRENAERLGINPLYRVSEGAETEILERAVMDSIIDRAYRGELVPEVMPDRFEQLCDALTGVKNTSALSDVLMALYEKTKSMVRGVEVFFDYAKNYSEYSQMPPERTTYVKYIMDELRAAILHFCGLYPSYVEPLDRVGDAAHSKLSLDISSICERLKRLAPDGISYEELREKICSLDFPRVPTVKDKTPEAILAIDFRRDMKESIIKIRDELFTYTAEEWQTLYRDMAGYVKTLAAFLSEFSKVYFEEKRRRGVLEFSDIERLAYDALYTPSGALTEVALEYRESLTSVYIDEYQDVNELQNKIFEAVSPVDKRFMVGDIKQSIYGFRSARPEIFADMKKRFPPLSAGYSTESSIFMSNNYRCDEGIVDFVNDVFDGLFGAVRESIGYVDADKLIFKKKVVDGAPYEKAGICLIEHPTPPLENEENEPENEAELYEVYAEAELVADKIGHLLKSGTHRDGSPIRPSDIAIIMRTKKNFSLFEEALSKRGIRSSAAEDRDFFLNKEILLTLSLLSSIDNPRKDIHLAALMCSPLYGFTADELYIIKTEGKGKTLYDSLVEYQKCNPEFTKTGKFLSELAHYRALCEGMNVDVLLTRLYQETGLLSLASKQGGKENLYKLYSYAKRFEGSAYKGLYNFITYVNTLIERGARIDKTESVAKEEDAVTIGTIHSSKGLEFPVVFLANAAAPLVNLDRRDRIAFSENFGISFLLRGPLGLALVENPLHRVIFDYMDKKFYEEIIRLLYVALTRAKEKLFIVGELKKKGAEEFLAAMSRARGSLTPYSIRRLKSYMEMITAATDNYDLAIYSAEDGEQDYLEVGESSADNSADGKVKEITLDTEALSITLTERFNFVYPSEHLTRLPEKISVSRLSPTVLDGSDEGEDALFTETAEKEERGEPIPRFITPDPIDESRGRGIATHNFLQFFDISRLKEGGVLNELSALTEKGFLSQKKASLVRVGELELFMRSELFSAMQKAKRLYREFRFNTRLPAHLFTTEEKNRELYKDSTVLVQGVIDCLIENEDGSLRLVDYKTDRLTKEELADEEKARLKLSAKHSLQLSYYALAVEKIFGKKPEKIEVYSLPLGKTVCLG